MKRSRAVYAIATGFLAAGCATPRVDGELSSLRSELKEQVAQCATVEAQGVTKFDALTATSQRLALALQEEIRKGAVTIKQLQGQLRLSVVQEILFDSGDAQLREPGQALLEKVFGAIQSIPTRLVTIEGHTDNVPIGAAIISMYPTNWELSTGRATAVVRSLESMGVESKDLSATGFGEFRPVATNETEAGRQQNRRIEVVLTLAAPDESEQASAEPSEE
jgi:chemotaxis protein MotB